MKLCWSLDRLPARTWILPWRAGCIQMAFSEPVADVAYLLWAKLLSPPVCLVGTLWRILSRKQYQAMVKFACKICLYTLNVDIWLVKTYMLPFWPLLIFCTDGHTRIVNLQWHNCSKWCLYLIFHHRMLSCLMQSIFPTLVFIYDNFSSKVTWIVLYRAQRSFWMNLFPTSR